MSVIIFINEKAINIHELIENKNYVLKKLDDQIYSIILNDKEIDWIIKIYKCKKHTKTESLKLKLMEDIENVPKILYYSFSYKINYIIMSKMKGIDMFDYIMNKNTKLKEIDIKHISIQILNTLKKIHSKGITHGDIKPENLIYDEETKKVSIIDFEEKHTTEYCSPEQILNKKISQKTDIWSLGTTIYMLYTQTLYFEDKADVLEKEIDFEDENMSYDFKDFLSCLLERNIVLRYNVSDALKHVFLQ